MNRNNTSSTITTVLQRMILIYSAMTGNRRVKPLNIAVTITAKCMPSQEETGGLHV